MAERVALALDNALLLRAQREALEEQVKFKALADATSDLIAITDTDSVATYVNARVAELGTQWVGSALPRRLRRVTSPRTSSTTSRRASPRAGAGAATSP